MDNETKKQVMEVYRERYRIPLHVSDNDVRSLPDYRKWVEIIAAWETRGRASGQQGVYVSRQLLEEAADGIDEYYDSNNGTVEKLRVVLAASPQITTPAEPMQKAWSEMTHIEREEHNRRAAQRNDSVQLLKKVLQICKDKESNYRQRSQEWANKQEYYIAQGYHDMATAALGIVDAVSLLEHEVTQDTHEQEKGAEENPKAG